MRFSKSQAKNFQRQNATIAELEAKIEEGVTQTAELLNEMSSTEAIFAQNTNTIRKQHSATLAVRDARVSELRGEADRVTKSLRVARETIHALRAESRGVRGQMGEERRRAKDAMDSMKEELQRVLYLSQSFPEDSQGGFNWRTCCRIEGEYDNSRTTVRTGEFPAEDSSRMRTRSSKKRNDSGLELLNEDVEI